jgi:hypothetical protein
VLPIAGKPGRDPTLKRHARYTGIRTPPTATRRVCEQVLRFLLHSIEQQLSDGSIGVDLGRRPWVGEGATTSEIPPSQHRVARRGAEGERVAKHVTVEQEARGSVLTGGGATDLGWRSWVGEEATDLAWLVCADLGRRLHEENHSGARRQLGPLDEWIGPRPKKMVWRVILEVLLQLFDFFRINFFKSL